MSLSPKAARAGVVLRIQGPLEIVSNNGVTHTLPGRRQAVLSALLARTNQVVSVDELVGAMWQGDPPATARAQVQICVHALRTEFEDKQVDATIVTQTPGYRLEVVRGAVDSDRFSCEVRKARLLRHRGSVEESSATYRNALDLWRGMALDGCPSKVRAQAAWLDELRLEVTEEWVSQELDLGRHNEVVAELKALVDQNPLAEQFRFLLMLALYRAGMQRAALDVFRVGRAVMIERLGLDPGERLRRLAAAILADDKSLMRNGTRRPDTVPMARETPWTNPRQLPATTNMLAGRFEQVERVVDLLAPHHALSVVNVVGQPGVGKSELVLHAAHRGDFADGQLYLSLRGLDAFEALGALLRGLGVCGAAVPNTVDERAEVYRSIVADRRLLVVLEDATCEAQVAQLLPGTPSCAVLVTSGVPLTGLNGCNLVTLDVLDPDDGLMLLREAIGETRVDAEPWEARALCDATGGLPLALRSIANQLAANPEWTLRAMLGRLADDSLDELPLVRESLLRAYDALDPGAAHLLLRLAALDADDLPEWVAVVLDGAGAVDTLVDHHLLDVVSSEPRFRLHKLTRAFARERQRDREPSLEAETLRRVLVAWLQLAAAQDGSDALGWLEVERANICAVVAQGALLGLDDLCWELVAEVVPMFEMCGYQDDLSHELASRFVWAS